MNTETTETQEPFAFVPQALTANPNIDADSDDSGHLFQSISDTVPGLSDSCRSEATLWGSHKGMSDRSQGFATVFGFIRSPSEGRRLGRQPKGVFAPSIRAGGERRQRTLELQFALPPVATRNGLTRPPE